MSASEPKPRQKFRAALIQMRTGREVTHNLIAASELIRKAVREGAQYVQTPEVTTIMELEKPKLFVAVKPEAGNPAIAHFQGLARELKVWLHVGSMAVALGPEKLANRSLLIGPTGAIVARYDKIHMFDVTLASGERYRESSTYQPGDKLVTADLPWGRLGLTICYDMRFPGLYRSLAKLGAEIISVPSAFTVKTGEAHWHTLLRARAIENGCFILAAAQGGKHENGRSTYGHSLIVAPWGEILAEGGTEPGVIAAEIDMARIDEARGQVPSLTHDRVFS
ncbi:MAG: hypothetical protein RL291_571 [Pseudomonadota bacterium]